MSGRTGDMPRRARLAAWLLGGAVAGLALAGCSGSSGGLTTGAADPTGSASMHATESTTTTPASSAPATTSSVDRATTAEADVRGDFQRYQDGYLTALRRRDERVPELVRYSTASQQQADRNVVQVMHQQNLELRGTPRLWLGAVTVSGNRAYLRVCEFDSAARFVDRDTGKTARAVKDVWLPYSVRLLSRDGRWLINSYDQAKFSCRGAHA